MIENKLLQGRVNRRTLLKGAGAAGAAGVAMSPALGLAAPGASPGAPVPQGRRSHHAGGRRLRLAVRPRPAFLIRLSIGHGDPGRVRGADRAQGRKHRRVRGPYRRNVGIERRPEHLDVPPPRGRHIPGRLAGRRRSGASQLRAVHHPRAWPGGGADPVHSPIRRRSRLPMPRRSSSICKTPQPLFPVCNRLDLWPIDRQCQVAEGA